MRVDHAWLAANSAAAVLLFVGPEIIARLTRVPHIQVCRPFKGEWAVSFANVRIDPRQDLTRKLVFRCVLLGTDLELSVQITKPKVSCP